MQGSFVPGGPIRPPLGKVEPVRLYRKPKRQRVARAVRMPVKAISPQELIAALESASIELGSKDLALDTQPLILGGVRFSAWNCKGIGGPKQAARLGVVADTDLREGVQLVLAAVKRLREEE